MKINGNSIELRTMIDSDKEPLAACWNGLSVIIPTSNDQEYFYYDAKKFNDIFAFDTRTIVTLVIHHKTDNKPIGYTVFKCMPDIDTVTTKFTIIDSSYQQKGLFLELNILRHRFIFNSNTTIKNVYTRVKQGQEHCLAGLYTKTGEVQNSINRGTYEHAKCTRDEWVAWFNASSYTNNIYEVTA